MLPLHCTRRRRLIREHVGQVSGWSRDRSPRTYVLVTSSYFAAERRRRLDERGSERHYAPVTDGDRTCIVGRYAPAPLSHHLLHRRAPATFNIARPAPAVCVVCVCVCVIQRLTDVTAAAATATAIHAPCVRLTTRRTEKKTPRKMQMKSTCHLFVCVCISFFSFFSFLGYVILNCLFVHSCYHLW